MRTKKLTFFSLVGVLLLGLAYAGIKVGFSKRDYVGTPLDVSFELVGVQETQVKQVPVELNCDGVLTPTFAYPGYVFIRDALNNGSEYDQISHIECYLPKAAGAETPSETLERFTSTVFLPDVLYGFLELDFEKNLRQVVEVGDARYSQLAWPALYLGQTAFAAYKSTNQKRFLDQYIRYFDRVMMIRDTDLGFHDEYHDQVMASWGATNLDKNPDGDPKWIAHVTHFSIIMLPATEFAREIKNNPELDAYLLWADKVIEFFDFAYSQFDTDLRLAEGTNHQWYWRPLRDRFEATNHVHLQGQALLNVYALTENPIYKSRIEEIIQVFEKGVTFHEDGLISWKYSPYFQVESVLKLEDMSEPSWKGSATVPFLFQAEKDGFLNNNKLLEALTRSIRDYITGDGTYKIYTYPPAEDVDDVMKKSNRAATVSGYHYGAWVDPAIEDNIVDIVASNPEMFSSAWFERPPLARSYGLLLDQNPDE